MSKGMIYVDEAKSLTKEITDTFDKLAEAAKFSEINLKVFLAQYHLYWLATMIAPQNRKKAKMIRNAARACNPIRKGGKE